MKFFKIERIAILLLLATFWNCNDQNKKQNDAANQAAENTETAEQQFGGLALYTVRDDMAQDAKGTLIAVASDGYANIEAAGYNNGNYYGMEPKYFKSFLDSIGLSPVSTHQGGLTYQNADSMVTAAKDAGFKFFVIPVPPMGMFKFDPQTRTMGMEGSLDSLVSILNTVGKKCSDAGLQLLYHNHDFEYKPNREGIVPIEYLLEHADPQYVNFQMDLFWVTKADADPVAYFEKYPGRFKAWHVKDMDEQGRFAPVGKGKIDFKRILAEKDTSGMEYYFVEQDQTFDGLKPLEAISISHKGLGDIGFK